MPSSQTPPPGSTAVDPTAVRPDIADARILRITPDALIATLRELKAQGFSQLTDIGGVDYLEREPRFDVVYHLLALPTREASIGDVGAPARVRVLCGVNENQ